MRRPRVAIIGSCVTRDVWNLAGYEDDARPDLLYIARNSFAALAAEPVAGFQAPETPPGDLTPWELRMVADDLLKRSLGKLADYAPTHLIIDFIDERFDLLRLGRTVVNHSWELYRSGLRDQPPLSALRRVPRCSPRATELWTRGFAAVAAFLRERLPETRIIFHDARWALDYVDEAGARIAFDPDRLLWPGLAANTHAHNAVLAQYRRVLRRELPAAFHVRAPAELVVGDAGHRWGLIPFHYVEGYYRYVWKRFEELGCGQPAR